MDELTGAQAERLAAAVKAHRGARGWTQTDLSAASGVDTNTISNLERARGRSLRPKTIAGVAKALRWSQADLAAILDGRPVAPKGGPDPIEDVLRNEAGRPLTDAELAWIRNYLRAGFSLLDGIDLPPADDSAPSDSA